MKHENAVLYIYIFYTTYRYTILCFFFSRFICCCQTLTTQHCIQVFLPFAAFIVHLYFITTRLFHTYAHTKMLDEKRQKTSHSHTILRRRAKKNLSHTHTLAFAFTSELKLIWKYIFSVFIDSIINSPISMIHLCL